MNWHAKSVDIPRIEARMGSSGPLVSAGPSGAEARVGPSPRGQEVSVVSQHKKLAILVAGGPAPARDLVGELRVGQDAPVTGLISVSR